MSRSLKKGPYVDPKLYSKVQRQQTGGRANAIREWFYAGAAELWESPPLDRINVRNGILNRETGDLEPHSPDFLSPVQ